MSHSNQPGKKNEVTTFLTEGGNFHLFREKDYKKKQKFLKHALNVYTLLSKKEPPGILDIMLQAKVDNPEAKEFCLDFLTEKHNVIGEELEERFLDDFFELDVLYKDDLMKAWDIELKLFYFDQTVSEYVRNEPFERTW